MQQEWDIILIGDGIAAQCILWELSQALQAQFPERSPRLLQLSSQTLAPACTRASTATVALRDATGDKGPLGKLVVESFHAFETFVKLHQPRGIVPAAFYKDQLPVEGADHVMGYCVDWEHFATWSQQALKRQAPLKNWQHQQAFVRALTIGDQAYELVTLKGEQFRTRCLILACGAYTKLFQALWPEHELIEASQPVPGSYLEFEQVDWGQQSFCYTQAKHNLIYRHEQRSLQIGSYDDKLKTWQASRQGLRQLYQAFSAQLPNQFSLPDFSQAKFVTGIRHKGKQRKPFWGELQGDQYKKCLGMFGLYKNAFSYAFLGAKKMAPQICEAIL